MSRPFRWLLAAVVSIIGAPVVVGVTVLATLVYLPLPSSLPAPLRSSFGSPVSVVYDAAGNVIGQFRAAAGSNVPVKYSQIPTVVKDAVVASEDRTFFQSGAVSVKGILRAARADLLSGAPVQGGSTITEQYVKDVYTNSSKTVSRKLREAILARILAQNLTKQQILHRYLSVVYLGQGAYGVGAAAQAYFRTPVEKLDASQAATLAGVLPAPSDYDPLFNRALAEQRRETVLGLMHQQGYLSDARYQRAMAEQLTLAQPNVPPVGPATLVYPPPQAPSHYRYFLDYVRQYLEQRIGYNELYHGGLHIQTTIVPKDQAAAQAAIATQLAGTSPPLQMALASVAPATGFVTALVGGRSYDVSQVDIALGGCPQPEPPPAKLIVESTCQAHPNSVVLGGGSGRLAGSTFKPFTLATALTQGISPQAPYNGPATYDAPGCGSVCVIHNAGGESGKFTLTTATWQSIDTVYVQVLKQVGIKAVAEMAKHLGVWSAYDESNFGLSYTLGTNPVSPLEMASAYATFANHGVYNAPSPVVRAVAASGKVVYDDAHPKGTRVLSAAVADTVTNILEGVIQHGTGNPNAVIGRPAAGKTGTANGPTDAWFVGYTPQLSAAAWMGYSNNDNTPMLDVKGVQVYGATYPAKAWHDFMMASLAGVPPAKFAKPPPLQAPPAVKSFQPAAPMTPIPSNDGGLSGPTPPAPPIAVAPPTYALPTTTTTYPPYQGGTYPGSTYPGSTYPGSTYPGSSYPTTSTTTTYPVTPNFGPLSTTPSSTTTGSGVP
ncbi:MAG: transglycosylase domain-containing protein [Acidimicrobiales bacterium]